jgi:hypothetical protein
VGAVSPAGWSAADLVNALTAGAPVSVVDWARPGRPVHLKARRVPGPVGDFALLRHPRLRRASPISRFAAAAAFEALGADAAAVREGARRLGIVFCVMAGCVNYSSRFYQEVLQDPATASPLIFPETVFNAPASHLAAVLGTTEINYTLVGDDSTLLQGLAIAAGWLVEKRIDGCLVIAAEEGDWLTAEAMQLFDPGTIVSEGAGAIYLRANAEEASRKEPGIELEGITALHAYRSGLPRAEQVRRVRLELESLGPATGLFDSRTGGGVRWNPEVAAWADWEGTCSSARLILGDAFCAGTAWQIIAATDALRRGTTKRAFVSVAGCNQAAGGLSLRRGG